ncbi:hypothetical protein ACN20G_18770 [Streptomyces sp. BI20]|uniref:hypothetical protein n=1 Tax=Streptomyces sp. BI20 TaxID=3403460 RepID=UPI003C708D57
MPVRSVHTDISTTTVTAGTTSASGGRRRAAALLGAAALAALSPAVLGGGAAQAQEQPQAPVPAVAQPAVQPAGGAPGGNHPFAYITPSVVAPGGYVGLNLQGCGGGQNGRAWSEAFGQVHLRGDGRGSNLFGSATVHHRIAPGSYIVTFECGEGGGRSTTAHLQVTPGAARGGLGGSIEGPSTTQMASGGAMVAVALGAGVWAVRRRAGAVRG